MIGERTVDDRIGDPYAGDVSVIIGMFFEISYSQDTIEKRMQKARIEAMKGWSKK